MLFFRSWGYEDFGAAVARAEALELPDMMNLVFRDNLSMNPDKVMPWAISKGMTPGGPQWEEGYRDWLATDEGSARAWFETQAATWERAGHDAALAGFLAAELSNAGFHTKYRQADPAVEQTAAKRLSDFLSRWHAKDSAAESRWRNAASKETRDRLAETEAAR
jgi:hypothetical protein